MELATGRVVGAELVSADPVTDVEADAFAFGPAAVEGWSLMVSITEAELIEAVEGGSAEAVAALGVRYVVSDFGRGHRAAATIRAAPVAAVRVNLAGLDHRDPTDVSLLRSVVDAADGLGIDVLGHHVESDDHLALADEAGVGLVQGYRWGSAGSLAKLLETWARPTLSE